jgi:hypothetical protein
MSKHTGQLAREAGRYLAATDPHYQWTPGVHGALEVMVAWTPAGAEDFDDHWRDLGPGTYPTAGQVEVGPWPDPYRYGWSNAYLMTGGACETVWHHCDEAERIARVMVLFNKLVVRDKLDPMTVHNAFLMIREYRESIAPDSPGLGGR